MSAQDHGKPAFASTGDTEEKAVTFSQLGDGLAYDEAMGLDHPRIWTAERDRQMWAALNG